jgi:hypothetical protein
MTMARMGIQCAGVLAVVGLAGVVALGGAGMRGQTPTPAPKPAKAPPPPEPIDPNATAGVRGFGQPIKVGVQYKSKPVDGASVLAKNPDGTVAGSCTTDATGGCTLTVGVGEYKFTAVQSGLAGEVSAPVTAGTKPIAIKLAKVKPGSNDGKP